MSKDKTSDASVSMGFDYWRPQHGHCIILLPSRLVEELTEKEEAMLEQKRAAKKEQLDAQVALLKEIEEEKKKEDEETLAFDLLTPPPEGWYRVLPSLDLQAYAGDSSTNTPDKDIHERRRKLAKQLHKLGPDRKLARPLNWRSECEILEDYMPNFVKPLRIVRNALAMAEATGKPVRIPPLLLLGPPGVGKTYFSQSLAEMLHAPHVTISFDQPSAGSQLRGSDKFWGNTESGVLFNRICLGTHANPVILLDEIDKATQLGSRASTDPLAQLHSVLEPQSSSKTVDISTEIEFDASQVTYIATANSLRGLTIPILSRFEVVEIDPPTRDEAVEIAQNLAQDLLKRLDLDERIRIDRKAHYVLSAMSPRLMKATLEKVVANAVYMEEKSITEAHVWREVDREDQESLLH